MTKTKTMIFNQLANYYDSIYAEKDYDQEVKTIDSQVKKHLTGRKHSLLDVGCGTGEHALRFAKKGYSVVGLDQSPVVLSIAQTKATNQQLELQLKLGDARTFSFPKKFDVIVCLFHVSSYLTTNRDLLAFFNSVSSHLEDTGIFIFDCWYGPGVLHSRPETQYKLHQHGHQKLHRIKVPVLNPDSNTVQVTHTIFAVDDRTQRVEPPFSETHNLRYFFFPEIELLLDQAGLEIVSWGNLLENFQPVKLGGWDAGFVVKRKNALAR